MSHSRKRTKMASESPLTGAPNAEALQDTMVPFPNEISNLIYQHVVAYSNICLACRYHAQGTNAVINGEKNGFGLRCTGSTIINLLLVSKETHKQMHEIIQKADIELSTDDLHRATLAGTSPIQTIRQVTLAIPRYNYEHHTIGSTLAETDIAAVLTTFPSIRRLTITNSYTIKVAGPVSAKPVGEGSNRRLTPYERLYFGTSLDPRVVGYPPDQQGKHQRRIADRERAPFTYSDMEEVPRYCVARSFVAALFAWNASTVDTPAKVKLKVEVVDEVGKVCESVWLLSMLNAVANMTLRDLSQCIGRVEVLRWKV